MSYVFNDGADAPVRMAPGRHKLVITGWETGFSNSGKAFIAVGFRNASNAKHTERFFLTEKAFWRLDLLFKSCGLRWPKGTPISPRAMGSLMIGRTADATLALGEPKANTGEPNANTGKQYLEIKELHPAAEYEAPPIPSEDDDNDDNDEVPF